MTNDRRGRGTCLRVRASSFVICSSFGFRHSSLRTGSPLASSRSRGPHMAHDPFPPNGDASGSSGVSGDPTTDGRSPALGRSSRDLASDTGPGAAAEEMFTTPDVDTQTTTGTGRDRTTGEEPSLRDRKTNPDVDPDTRLGLRPATDGMVAPRQPAYPEMGPRTRAATGAVAGVVGGAIATAVWYALFWAGASPVPPSLAVARTGMGLQG